MVSLPVADDERVLSARLTRRGRIYASRQRMVRAGRGRVGVRFGRAVQPARYLLVVELRAKDGSRSVVKRRVDLRR